MAEDKWADHIIVQALAIMLCVDINVLCTIGQVEQHITCSSSATGVVNIGPIGKLCCSQHTNGTTEDQNTQCDPLSTTSEQVEYEFEASDKEDEEVTHETTQIRWLPFESGLQELDADKAYSIVPGNLFRH